MTEKNGGSSRKKPHPSLLRAQDLLHLVQPQPRSAAPEQQHGLAGQLVQRARHLVGSPRRPVRLFSLLAGISPISPSHACLDAPPTVQGGVFALSAGVQHRSTRGQRVLGVLERCIRVGLCQPVVRRACAGAPGGPQSQVLCPGGVLTSRPIRIFLGVCACGSVGAAATASPAYWHLM